MATMWHYRRKVDGASLYVGVGADEKIQSVLTGKLGSMNERQKLHFRRKLIGRTFEDLAAVLSGAWELADVFEEDQPLDLFEDIDPTTGEPYSLEHKVSQLRRMMLRIAARFPESRT